MRIYAKARVKASVVYVKMHLSLMRGQGLGKFRGKGSYIRARASARVIGQEGVQG